MCGFFLIYSDTPHEHTAVLETIRAITSNVCSVWLLISVKVTVEPNKQRKRAEVPISLNIPTSPRGLLSLAFKEHSRNKIKRVS